MAKLPPLTTLPSPIQSNPKVRRAYDAICGLEGSLELELNAPELASDGHPLVGPAVSTGRGQAQEFSLVCCRLLGYLLLYAPNERAREHVADEIIECEGRKERLEDLGRFYYVCFIGVFQSRSCRTPIPSPDSPPFNRPAFDIREDMDRDVRRDPPLDHVTAKKYALIRDGYRCVMTGYYDGPSCEALPQLAQKVTEKRSPASITRCFHFLPILEPDSENGNSDQRHPGDNGKSKNPPLDVNLNEGWTRILRNFGYADVVDEMYSDPSGLGAHRLDNAVTLRLDTCLTFQESRIWIAPLDDPATQPPNTYKLEASDPIFLIGQPPTLTFQSSDPANLPLPNSRYLEIYTSCARVAHFSGARRFMEDVLKDYEERGVLESDGSSASLLAHLLILNQTRRD
ncbi:hypothetical protein CC1G_03179 [Coprinopsis cinerea okayama7|uniref:HNH nuclease domain-containing protein n=1 Tax=Coprinopsis cinerea (strain Okayama-7 / 130 / ATCC MYA-4618 / FGSC 9003) TaxID=240176 RepID=A8PF77_COPC7|nr:hypothetical protein CC1G_03179 [Coprinopsis cinerea okayama7\|eukprot:XP_001840950.2 hypothetical protein CC1G_03179 [Coprinopsis cinerea okayama7\